MSEMKNSGVKWIDKIPQEWNLKRFKYIGKIQYGYPFNSDNFSNDKGFPIIRIRDITSGNIETYYDGAYSTDYVISKGDILIGMDGDFNIREWNGEDALLNQRCCRLFDTSKLSKKFMKYFLTIQLKIANDLTWSTTVKHLLSNDIDNFNVCFPIIREQKLIVDFLDKKTKKIDMILNDLNSQIEILYKYKKSLITETVTKEIELNVDMKDSDIKWIGMMPKSWQICRIKDVCSLARGGSPRPIDEYLSYNDKDINWIKIGDTIKGYKYIDSTEQKIIKAGISKSRYVQKGDLILTNSMSFGQPYILNINGCIHDGWLVFSNYKGIDKLFLYYVLMSDICFYQFKKSVAGAVVENLNIDKVASSKILVPPLYIQEKIISYLEDKCNKIDELVEDKQKQIEKMERYKKSLIYEYVTGKKRVKGAEELYG